MKLPQVFIMYSSPLSIANWFERFLPQSASKSSSVHPLAAIKATKAPAKAPKKAMKTAKAAAKAPAKAAAKAMKAAKKQVMAMKAMKAMRAFDPSTTQSISNTRFVHPLTAMKVKKDSDKDKCNSHCRECAHEMHVGKLIEAKIDEESTANEAEPFDYFDRGSMAVISRFNAVVKLGKTEFSGFPAWISWLGLHIAYIVGFRSRALVALHWLLNAVSRDRGNLEITQQQRVARNALNKD